MGLLPALPGLQAAVAERPIMAASTFRATGIPGWDQAGQGPAQSWVVTHLWLHQYLSAYQSTQEGGPPFSKGAATPVRSFRVMGMRRVSVRVNQLHWGRFEE